jgi:SAM-dependent methyltransferase
MLYEHPDLYDALLPVGCECVGFYTELARRQSGPVLELACGTGQLLAPIARPGLATVGLDLSPRMLDAARRRLAAADAEVELIEGDMRSFDLGRRFALVFVARNSLLHLGAAAELQAVFAAVRRHLAPDGVFAFDVFNPDVRILAQPPGERRPLLAVTSATLGELTVEATHDYDAATQVDRGVWYVSAPGRRDAWVAPIHVRSIFPQELPLLVASAGLRLVERYGDYAGRPFESGSPRQVCVCRAA